MREGGIWVFIEWANGAPREVCYELLGAARQLREDLARTGREATVWAVTFSSPSAAREQDLRRAGAQGLLEIPWKEAKSLDEILVSAALAGWRKPIIRKSCSWARRRLAAASRRAWPRGKTRG